MTDLNTYAAGKTDTSQEAFEAVKKMPLRVQVLTALDHAKNGLTSEEISDLLGIEYGSIQPRTSELQLLGAVKDSGRRRKNRRGRKVIVWEIDRG